jgi:hypothetical protein
LADRILEDATLPKKIRFGLARTQILAMLDGIKLFNICGTDELFYALKKLNEAYSKGITGFNYFELQCVKAMLIADFVMDKLFSKSARSKTA